MTLTPPSGLAHPLLPLTLGIDLGTSAVKLAALDATGTVRAAASAPFPTRSALPGQAEQDPADWLAAAAQAVSALDGPLTALGDWRGRIAAIGLAGQLPTLVCIGPDGVLAPAITWEDARTDAWVSERLDASERRAIYERTGMPIDGRYLAPMLRCHRADRIDAMTAMLSAKDYLCYALTGACLTDPSTAAGYGVYDLERNAFSEDLCARWELPSRLLPAVRPAHALAAPLADAGARLLGLPCGVPVTVGAADSVAGAYALAGLEEGTVCISMGSSTIIIDSLNSARLDPQARYLLTPHVEPGWYGREMDLLASGTGYRWLSGLFGWREGELDRMAAQSVPGARGLNFAPYLARGEQGALWNPALRGAIHGLGLTHGPQDIARAFVEGVSFEILRCLDVLGTRGAAQSLVVSGAIVERATSLQVLADVLAQPVYAVRAVSPAAEGAAMGARVLANLPPGVPHARRGTVACVQPSAERVARYRQLYDDYRAVVDR